jgi:hypothetical protein
MHVSQKHNYDDPLPHNYVDLGNGFVAPGLPEYQSIGTANYDEYFNDFTFTVYADQVYRHLTVSSEQFTRPDDYDTSRISWTTIFRYTIQAV